MNSLRQVEHLRWRNQPRLEDNVRGTWAGTWCRLRRTDGRTDVVRFRSHYPGHLHSLTYDSQIVCLTARMEELGMYVTRLQRVS